MSEEGLICYASPKGYGKTYYELEKFMEELRNKLISDKFKEHFDESAIGLTIYNLRSEKDKLQQENSQLKERIEKAIEYILNGRYAEEDDYESISVHMPTLLDLLKGDNTNE